MYYRICAVQLPQMLTNLSGWLDAAAEHAKGLEYDPENLLRARLYPNQYELRRQVQITCDTAKGTGARLTGKQAPAHEDTDQSIDELKARIDDVKQFLSSLSEADFDGAAERKVTLPFAADKYALGEDYLHQFGLPNFYFHITTAYSIMRHSGVPLGKIQFIGFMSMKDKE